MGNQTPLQKTETRCYIIILLCIFSVGLILRLVLVAYVTPFPERYIKSDAVGYNQIASNLVYGRGFSMEASKPFTPDNFRTPVYPLTLASIYALFDFHPDIILWLQAFMGAFTILLVYYITNRICGQNVGLIAGALLAISPHSITYSALLWSDTEYTLFFTLSIILTIIMLAETNLKWVLLSGFVSGISVLTHPRSLYLPILIALLFIVVMILRRYTFKQILMYIGAYILIFNLVLLPWRLRNNATFGVPNITSAPGINMLFYGAALTEAAQTGEDQWSIAQRYNDEVREMSLHPLNPAEFAEVAFRMGLRKIFQNPLIYAKVHIIGMFKIFLPGTSQINTLLTGYDSLDSAKIYALFTTGWNLQDPLVLQLLSELPIFVWCYISFEILYLGCIYLFSIYALIKHGRSPWLWFILFVLLYLTVVAGSVGAPRFRVVMMPMFCVLAACGIASIKYVSRKMELLCKSQL